MGDNGRGIREREEPGKIRTGIDIVYDPQKHRIRHTVHLVGGHTGPIISVAITPDGRPIFSRCHRSVLYGGNP